MSIAEFFRRLCAPLVNKRWSWGGVRQDGAVLLRVWQDETIVFEGKRLARLTDRRSYLESGHLGFEGRLRHVEAMRSGAVAYAVVVRADDPKAVPKSIAFFDRRRLFKLGPVQIIDGYKWTEFAIPVAARDLIREAP